MLLPQSNGEADSVLCCPALTTEITVQFIALMVDVVFYSFMRHTHGLCLLHVVLLMMLACWCAVVLLASNLGKANFAFEILTF